MGTLVVVGAVVGAVVGYVGLAQQRLAKHQSRLRWVPALVIGGDLAGLALLLGCVVLGAVLGGSVGWLGYTLVDAVAR